MDGIVLHVCDHGLEVGLAVGLALKILKQFLVIGFVVVTFSGITGRIYAWSTIERRHLQTAVVGDTVESIIFLHILGLDLGVFLESGAGLGDVGIAANVRQTADIEPIAQYCTHLVQLMGVVGSEHNRFLVAHLVNLHLIKTLAIHTLNISHGQKRIGVNLFD